MPIPLRPSLGSSGATIVGTICLIAVAVLAGCGGSDGEEAADAGARQRLGEPEGALSLIALPGYVQDGEPQGSPDWVTPFEKRTGCEVTHTVTDSPDEVVRLLRGGGYDGVTARGDVSLRLVDEGYVDPLNLDLVPNHEDVFEALQELPSNTVDGVSYGVPQGRDANMLMRARPAVRIDPEEAASWDVIFDPELASRYPDRITAYDGPLSIADAAIYLRDAEPELEISNPYELDQEQFEAVLELLREQRPFVGRYWRTAEQNARAFVEGATVVGPARRQSAFRAQQGGAKVELILPDEGLSGFADSWMLASNARHPSCMYLWMDHMLSPGANAAVAEHTLQAPSSERACDVTADAAHCDNYHAADEELFEEVEYWATPLSDCGDDRGDVCADYGDWARAFAEIQGSGRR